MQPRVAYGIDRRGALNVVAFHGLVSVGFLAFGAVAWVLPDSIVGASPGARLAIAGVALGGAALFGWTGIRFLERLRSNAPLFVLDPKGFWDNGSAVFSGVGRSARLGYPAVAFRAPLLPGDPERIVEEVRAYVRAVPTGDA